MDEIVALADATRLGGKAGALARLIAAGLPVPEGVVVRGAPAGVGEAVAALAPLAVRSSMSIEDGGAGAAAGVFASRIGVAAGDVGAAIAAVQASAQTPLARAYAAGRGFDVAVIVQRAVSGPRTTVYTRPPGRPDADEAWIEQAGGAVVRVARADPRVAIAIAAERAIDAARGADVELVGDWVVQARPIVHPPPPRPRVAPPRALFSFSSATPSATWRWDVAHNPDPLSPAQAGLVDAVVAAGAAPWRMGLAAGYLYVADDPSPNLDLPHDLRAQWDARIAAMRAHVSTPARDVAAAIADYVAAFRIYARELAPLVAAARRGRTTPARRTGALDSMLIAAARGELDEDVAIARARDHAPAWDVAVPTYGERPELVRAAIARLRALVGELPPPADTPDLAATLAEEDDDAFAAAQAHVRRALLDAGVAIGLPDPGDAAWLPLAELACGHLLDPDRARARAHAARRAAERARDWTMPLAVRAGVPLPEPARGWTGAGSGGRVAGIARRIGDLGAAALVPPGAIAVVPTVTPALALVLAGARAIVSGHGGVLDHGAAIARELGVPCVVGCAGAWDELRDGELVEVDGDAGSVRRA